MPSTLIAPGVGFVFCYIYLTVAVNSLSIVGTHTPFISLSISFLLA